MTFLKGLTSLAVLVIGVYMIVSYWGPLSPPLLSGIAFTLLGLANSCSAFFPGKK